VPTREGRTQGRLPDEALQVRRVLELMKPAFLLLAALLVVAQRALAPIPIVVAQAACGVGLATFGAMWLHWWWRWNRVKRSEPPSAEEYVDCAATRELAPGLTLECHYRRGHEGQHAGSPCDVRWS
jgi:hypothetical protein